MTVEAFPIEPIRLVLDRLLGHKKVGERQWEARCPRTRTRARASR
jgi:hypothetical protein